jgi:RNA polymerase sigma-70 factor, ECF subfamily
LLSSAEEAQFWLFYRETSAALHRKAYRMCRGNKADADDAHQRTYLQALKHWRTRLSGMADKQRNAWLTTTLANEALQIWRAPHRSRETAAPDDLGWDPATLAVTVDVDAVVAADAYHNVCRAIAQLGGRQREVVALHCLAGYEISEVAEMLGIKTSTVRAHLHAGRASVREMMAREEESA